MKKFAILALAALLVVAFTVPATALENEFGGYWRTRFYNQGQFNGDSDIDNNRRQVDTRTHLYYTARINDNLKFVNKFEFDATWGSSNGGSRNGAGAGGNNTSYGAVDADGANIEIKNSYADFNLGPVNLTVGVQPYSLFRDFHISTDASGLIGRWKVLDNFVLAASWLKAFEGGPGSGNNDDVDAYTVTGAFWFSENMSIKPSISYVTSSDAATFANATLGTSALITIGPGAPLDAARTGAVNDDLQLWTYGFDFDASFDMFGLWATAYMQSGSAGTTGSDIDFKGWLAAVGGNVGLGPVDLHTQIIYAPGDDDSDSDLDQVYSPNGSYYWAEIMGYGMFDTAASAGSPIDKVANLMAFNLGATMKPMDKLKLTVDLWYAQLEDDTFGPGSTATSSGEDELGTELDVKVTYELVEGLNLDLVGAYLWAGDATSSDGNNQEDPYEFGARLSLSF